MSRSPAREPVVLLVHGAHHGSWCWEEVTQRLGAAGVRSHAIDLPFTCFTDDTEAVRAAIREAARHGPVLLVTHSYGGLPVSAGGSAAAYLVYIAARMPLPGESPAQLTPTWNDPAFHRSVQTAPDDPAWLTVPSAYVVCAADRTVRPQAQHTVPHVPPHTSNSTAITRRSTPRPSH